MGIYVHVYIYFSRKFITTTKYVVNVETMYFRGMLIIICLILAFKKEPVYMRQDSILKIYTNMFQKNTLIMLKPAVHPAGT